MATIPDRGPSRPPSSWTTVQRADGSLGADTIDLVAVQCTHPEAGNAWKTSEGIKWLCDLLPKDIRGAGIYAFDSDYDAGNRNIRALSLQINATTLVSELKTLPSSDRPLVLIGHGFGGSIIEEVSDITSPYLCILLLC